MTNIVITGAGRGIGLALTRHYTQAGARVVAVCRTVSPELQATGATLISGIDVSHSGTFDRLAAELTQHINGEHVDILINNAGIMFTEQIGQLDYQNMLTQYQINGLAPVFIANALTPVMRSGSKIVMITSRMGSIADNESGGYYGYRMSKAALNIASASLAQDLKPKGIVVAVLHPGFVQTDMVNGAGNITAEQSAQALALQIDQYNLANSGEFRHSDGQPLPW